MNRPERLPKSIHVLGFGAVALVIFAVGLQVSFYETFSRFSWWDDEGTMMLRVSEFLRDPRSPSAFSGIYGPFYYLHKYVIYSALGSEVSHDVNRWTTILFWGAVAAGCGFYVHRISRSIVLAAVVQMQLVLHLRAFASEPGHPHEIALFLLTTAIILSTCASRRPLDFFAMFGIGAIAGALLLVKLNLGAFFIAGLALALLPMLHRRTAVFVLWGIAAAIAIVMPATIMSRHLEEHWAWNYCATITLAIVSCLLTSTRFGVPGEMRWSHVMSAGTGAAATVAGVSVALLAWGHSPVELAGTLVMRAMSFPTQFVIPAPIPQSAVVLGCIGLLGAVLYSAFASRLDHSEVAQLKLAAGKLAYGCSAFLSLCILGPGVMRQSFAVPFLWIVLVRTGPGHSRRGDFARLLLCFLAVFQMLQAYPVHGSQATWAVFLIAPLAAVCVGDALNTLWKPDVPGMHALSTRLPSLALLFAFATAYYQTANVSGRASAYDEKTPLDLPGAELVRLTPEEVAPLRWLAQRLQNNCDGFVGVPGIASQYFWTRISPPAALSNAWIVSRNDEQQMAVIEKMKGYERPCVVHNLGLVNFWTGDDPLDRDMPLVRYIDEHFQVVEHHDGFEILTRKDVPAGH